MASAHAHGDGHAHGPGAPLGTAFALTAGVALLEFAGSLYAHSLALLADSAHVLMDAVALFIAYGAAAGARRPANDRRSYGYARFEILAALANGVLLFAVAVFIAVAAVDRFGAHDVPQGGIMALVAAAGFALNVGIGVALLRGAHGDLSVRAALYHVAGDVASSVAVLLGGLAILWTRSTWIDPALSLCVAAVIVAGVVAIVREAGDVLLQSVPAHAPIAAVRAAMNEVAGVFDVHDLHVWSIGSGSHVLSAHVLLEDARISEATAILRLLETRLREEFAIEHVTLQFECVSCGETDRVVCTQARAAAL